MIDPPLPVHQCEFGNAPFWIESCDLVIFVNHHFHKVVVYGFIMRCGAGCN